MGNRLVWSIVMAGLLKVNGIDFTDIMALDGYSISEEDLHADGSGRNPLTGKMQFVIVASKKYLDITTRNGVPPERIAQFMNAIKANNRQNNYYVWNPITNKYESFKGYVNKRQINTYLKNPYKTLLSSTTIHIAEM